MGACSWLKQALPPLWLGCLERGLWGRGSLGFGIQRPAVLTCGHPQKYLVFKTSPKYCVLQAGLRMQELLLLLIPLLGPLSSRLHAGEP